MFRSAALISLAFLLMASSGCNRQPAEPPYTPGLGEIMTLTQMRHAKLWFAGQTGNWPLASYELDELNEGLEDAAHYHPTHKDAGLPVPQLINTIIRPPIDHLTESVKAQDQERFFKDFDELTEACNSCHQAMKFGFNVVTRPVANPYSNQLFQPSRQ